jgi:hypothetical protein
MRQLEEALRQLAERAEPLPTEVVIARIETELGWAGATPAVAEREESTMVTRQQPDLEALTPTPPPRSRRGPLVAAAVAAVVILAGVGIAFATGVFESESDPAAERLAVATEIVDAWSAAWVATDGEAVAALFTEDGVQRDPGFGRISGRDAIMRDVNSFRGSGVTRGLRTGDLVATDDGTFIYPLEFDTDGETWAGEIEVQLEGNLISRLEWLHWELKE